MIDTSKFPVEVYNYVSWHIANIPDLAEVRYTAKIEASGMLARYSIEIDPRDKCNPWYNAHTPNYWVWWRRLRPGEVAGCSMSNPHEIDYDIDERVYKAHGLHRAKCAFCKSKKNELIGRPDYFVLCNDCQAEGPTKADPLKAVIAWNRSSRLFCFLCRWFP